MHQRKRYGRRFSIRALILAVLLCLSAVLILPVSAKSTVWNPAGGARDVVSDVGDAVSDVGDALSEAVTDMMNGENGEVSDSDGFIGNESEEATETEPVEDEDGGMGWIAVLIAIAVVAVAIILIVVLVPKKRKD